MATPARSQALATSASTPCKSKTATDPDEAGTEHRLGDWLNYDHDALNTGSQLNVTASYGDLDLTWTRPAGYTRAIGILDQRLYVKDTGQTSINAAARDTNPFVSPSYDDVMGDGTSGSRDLSAYIGQAVAVGMKVEFDDSVTVHDNSDGLAYDIASGMTSLTEAGRGLVVMIYDPTPTLTGLRQDTCFDPETDVDLYVTPDMEGPSGGRLEIQQDGGAWTYVTNVSAGVNFEIGPYTYPGGHNYTMRLRYTSVSPDSWDESNTIFASCDA